MNRLMKLVQAAAAAAATALVTGPRPAVSQIKAPTAVVKTAPVAVVTAPQGLAVAATSGGPQLTWQKSANAASYRVQRASTSASAPVTLASVAATTLSYVDAGYATAAVYSVVAVGASGQTAASAAVSYAPPAPVKASPAVVTTPVAVKPAVSPATAASSTAPQITSVGTPDATGQVVLHIGDTVTATGTGLLGLTSLGFTGSSCSSIGSTCQPNQNDKGTPATVLGTSATSVRFVVPTVTLPYAGPGGTSQVYYYIVATRGLLADTTAKFWLGAKVVVRQFTDAQPRTVLAGQTVSITGVGLETMEGAYFGTGVLGSATNPMFTVSAASTSASLRIPSQCDQQGILMLSDLNPTHVGMATSAVSPPITLTCVSVAPSGHIVGTESGAIVYAKPGGTVTIQGPSLSIVTDVVDQGTGTHFSFAQANSGSTQSLVVSLPSNAKRFVPTLVSPLPTGVAPGTVTGTVLIMQPPTWSAVAPAWSEPLEVVRLVGHNLSNGGAPTVTVGGVAAQVTSYDDLNVYFRLGPNTTAGPIVVQNAGGTVRATGSFPSTSGVSVPGFFVVSGPSTITEIIKPKPTISYGDTLIVHGQNLAPLGGICVSLPTSTPSNGQMAYVSMMRVTAPAGRGFEASNTEMLVVFSRDPTSMVSAPVKLFSAIGASDYLTDMALFSCNTNPGGVSLP